MEKEQTDTKKKGTSLLFVFIEILVVISKQKFRLAIIKNFLSARAAKYLLILPKRKQSSILDLFIKKVKENMSHISSWQY